MQVGKLWVAYSGLVQREFGRWCRTWGQSALPSLITSILYFIIFGNVIGHRVGAMSGVPYEVYILPGLVMQAMILNAYSNLTTSVYVARFTRSFEELLVALIPNWVIIAGYLTGGLMRGMVIGILVSLVGYVFTDTLPVHIGLAILTGIFSSVLFAAAGFLNGIFARNFDDTAIISTFILTPLIFLGGVFYPIQDLPPFWRAVSSLNPVHFIIELFRFAYLGVGSYQQAFVFFGLLLGVIALLVFASWWILHKGIRVKS